MDYYYPINSSDFSYDYLLIVHNDINKYLSKEKFLKKSKVKKQSYAGNLMSRIYDSIVLDTIDLKGEYDKYYSQEYLDFELFLYNKYLIDYYELEYIENYKRDGYTIYFGDLKNNDGYGLASFIKERPELIEKINKIIEECMNEN